MKNTFTLSLLTDKRSLTPYLWLAPTLFLFTINTIMLM